MDKVWVVIDRGALFGVYRTREAACDDFASIANKRYGINIGFRDRGNGVWIAVGPNIGVVTVEERTVQD